MEEQKEATKSLEGYVGKTLLIRYNEQGGDWERCGWSIESSQQILLEGFLKKDGCIYLVGHEEGKDLLVASRCKLMEEYECGECGEISEITEICEDGKTTGLANLLKRLSKHHEGPVLIVDKKKREPGQSNYFFSQDYMKGNDMIMLAEEQSLEMRSDEQ